MTCVNGMNPLPLWVFLEMGGGGQATHGILTERIPPPLVQILTFQHCLKVRNDLAYTLETQVKL